MNTEVDSGQRPVIALSLLLLIPVAWVLCGRFLASRYRDADIFGIHVANAAIHLHLPASIVALAISSIALYRRERPRLLVAVVITMAFLWFANSLIFAVRFWLL